ncbi:SH3 domain-containing protein [Helicobacter sp. 10-6591]|uniref:SH3 domain-containing protein n=1 Tax=Helicobacter sp. 10-6591 TaxID=2004998 RepID=UPI000DCC79FC|nr:SH3 domain-containing protein [Helicobacter sp. 10-6591]RAX51701.1 hypothetical protein CCY97_07995 [Helicobacter sp. 10-6591]
MPKFSKKTGYPFDRWQNSLIFAGTPVLITHFDTSLRFAHIQAGFVFLPSLLRNVYIQN